MSRFQYQPVLTGHSLWVYNRSGFLILCRHNTLDWHFVSSVAPKPQDLHHCFFHSSFIKPGKKHFHNIFSWLSDSFINQLTKGCSSGYLLTQQQTPLTLSSSLSRKLNKKLLFYLQPVESLLQHLPVLGSALGACSQRAELFRQKAQTPSSDNAFLQHSFCRQQRIKFSCSCRMWG